MSTKIFEGFSSDRELEVRGAEDGSQVDLLIRRAGTGIFTTGIAIAPSDAPSLALAILEAAGVDLNESWSGLDPYGTPSHLGWIGGHLRVYVRQFANDQDKAKEQAELEAEALELLNAHREATGNPLAESLDGLLYNSKENWLAVARRAREMRAEK